MKSTRDEDGRIRRGKVTYPEITFKDFATVAKKRSHTVESLADRFRGKIETPCKKRREPVNG